MFDINVKATKQYSGTELKAISDEIQFLMQSGGIQSASCVENKLLEKGFALDDHSDKSGNIFKLCLTCMTNRCFFGFKI